MKNEKRDRDHHRTTSMLIAVVLTFVITELPQGILVIVCSFNDTYRDYYYDLGDLLDIIVLLNSSVNFVLYATMSQQFRDTFRAKLINPVLKVVKANSKNEDILEIPELTKLNEDNGKYLMRTVVIHP